MAALLTSNCKTVRAHVPAPTPDSWCGMKILRLGVPFRANLRLKPWRFHSTAAVDSPATKQPEVHPDLRHAGFAAAANRECSSDVPNDSKLSRKRSCSVKTGLSVPPAPGGHARGRGSQLPQRGQTIASRSGAETRPHRRGKSEAPQDTGEWLAHAAAHPRATPRKVALTTRTTAIFALSLKVHFSSKWRARRFFSDI